MRAEPRTLRQLGMGEIFHRLDDLVERIDAHHPDRLGDRVEALQRARERTGMRKRGLSAFFGAADLDRDDRLAGVARIFAGGRTPRRPLIDSMKQAIARMSGSSAR